MKLFKIKCIALGIFFPAIISCSDTPSSTNIPDIKTAGSQNINKHIPLAEKGDWYILKYDSLPANQVTFSENGLSIKVDKSASPLIYPLTDNPFLIKKVSIVGDTDKLVSIKNPDQQGEKGFDDFNLRFGLVLIGSNRLNWFRRKIAAKWVIEMYNLAPKNQGIDHVEFLNAVLSPNRLNIVRSQFKYLKERNVWLMNKPGAFSHSHTFSNPRHTVALWIAVDGDDTQSSFTLNIKQILLEGFE